MKIAYVTHSNALDIRAFSGTAFYLREALQKGGFQVQTLAHIARQYRPYSRLKRHFYQWVWSKQYQWDREPGILKQYARRISRELKGSDCEVVFSVGCQPIAYLETDKPIIYVSDATFAGMVDFYPEYTNLCGETLRHGNEIEQLALSKASLCVFSSRWAADSAVENYKVDRAKVKVIPFGANLECGRDAGDIRKIISRKKSGGCQLLLVGVDWVRKGGDAAVKVAEGLNRRGLKTELHVVGCRPPGKVPGFVKVHGFVSKKTREGRDFIDRMFQESHFFICPSRAECFGIVFAEASSFGLPSLATNVGGITTAIRKDKNGRTFPLDEDPEKYCGYILKTLSSPKKYGDLCLSSFKEYSERLNWKVFGKAVERLTGKF